MCPGKFKHRYRQTRVFREGIFTRSAAQSVLSVISSKDFQKSYSLKTPKFTSHYGEVQCTHASIFIAGNIMLGLVLICGLVKFINRPQVDTKNSQELCVKRRGSLKGKNIWIHPSRN